LITLILVGLSPAARERMRAARERSSKAGYRSAPSDMASLADAAVVAARTRSAVVLFEVSAVTETLARQIRAFRKSCPLAPLCAFISSPSITAEEIGSLLDAGADSFADGSSLQKRQEVHNLLFQLSNLLVLNKARHLVGTRVGSDAQAAAEPVLVELFAEWIPPASRKSIAQKYKSAHAPEHVPREVFDTALRLLLLVLLMEQRDCPLAQVYQIAGFPSSDDARRLLLRYSGMHAYELRNEGGVVRCILALLEVLAGKQNPRDHGITGSREQGSKN
jgi:hypothetical protein